MGYLSNDYGMFDDRTQPVLQTPAEHSHVGGMNLYVCNFLPGGTHNLFYTERGIIDACKNYFGWELGNDLHCSSTYPRLRNAIQLRN